jgi:hypothetical protein
MKEPLMVKTQSTKIKAKPLPRELLDWQVALRRHTMNEAHGAPHAGVAPLLTVKRPGGSLGVTTHSIICGLLPAPELLERKTQEFRELYEGGIEAGARAVYDRGIEYLRAYYQQPEDFDAHSITTLLAASSPTVTALRADGRCALVFYVFNLMDRSEIGKLRCLHLDCVAEVLEAGPVYENVWWHNTLFHGKAEDHVVLHFHHQRTLDTRFGMLEELS